jgi:hypothetical protein
MLRAKVLAQQWVDRDARAIGAKEPTLMTEERDGEHVRACCHEPSRAGRAEGLHLDGLFGLATQRRGDGSSRSHNNTDSCTVSGDMQRTRRRAGADGSHRETKPPQDGSGGAGGGGGAHREFDCRPRGIRQ